jgi:hypothetical protein
VPPEAVQPACVAVAHEPFGRQQAPVAPAPIEYVNCIRVAVVEDSALPKRIEEYARDASALPAARDTVRSIDWPNVQLSTISTSRLPSAGS